MKLEITQGGIYKTICKAFWSWNFNTLATLCEELTHLKRPWCWERWKAGGEGDDRGWYGWMASPTQWTWVWASSVSWWWTVKLGVLQSMRSQRVRHDWVTELKWTESEYMAYINCCSFGMILMVLEQDSKIPLFHIYKLSYNAILVDAANFFLHSFLSNQRKWSLFKMLKNRESSLMLMSNRKHKKD